MAVLLPRNTGRMTLATSLRSQPLLQLLGTLLTLHIAALGLFSSGFLLSRVEITTRSTCTDSPFRNNTPRSSNDSTHSTVEPWQEGCWGDKHFSKSVWVVIDALRLDFVTCSHPGLNDSACRSRMPKLFDLTQSSVRFAQRCINQSSDRTYQAMEPIRQMMMSPSSSDGTLNR